jgi:ketosteroid isomerase-like protein
MWKGPDMTNPNADLIRSGYDAFGQGDIAAVLRMLDPEVVWHVPGRSPLSGDNKGHDDVVGFFGRTMKLSGRTFKIDIDAVLAEGERVVVLCTVSAERHGRYWESPEVHVWRVADDLAVEFCEYQGDEHTEDQFWS